MDTSVCGILRRGERILIARRVIRGPLGGKWEFPGGKVEPSETPASALVREFQEELSLQISVQGLLAETWFEHGGRRVRLLAFEVSSEGEPVVHEDHTELRWVLPQQFSLFDFPESDRSLIDLLFS